MGIGILVKFKYEDSCKLKKIKDSDILYGIIKILFFYIEMDKGAFNEYMVEYMGEEICPYQNMKQLLGSNLEFQINEKEDAELTISKRKNAENGSLKALGDIIETEYESNEIYCGILNIGNTCFMNSALQCLINFKMFTNIFFSSLYTKHVNKENRFGFGGDMADLFYRLLIHMRENKVAKIRFFKEGFSKLTKKFLEFDEQDLSEFIIGLLDGLHEDLKMKKEEVTRLLELFDEKHINFENLMKDAPMEFQTTTGKKNMKEDIIISSYFMGLSPDYTKFIMSNTSVITILFGGQLRSTLTCTKCNSTSKTYEPFMILDLPLPKTGSYMFLKLLTQKIPKKVYVESEMTVEAFKTKMKFERSIDIICFSKKGRHVTTTVKDIYCAYEVDVKDYPSYFSYISANEYDYNVIKNDDKISCSEDSEMSYEKSAVSESKDTVECDVIRRSKDGCLLYIKSTKYLIIHHEISIPLWIRFSGVEKADYLTIYDSLKIYCTKEVTLDEFINNSKLMYGVYKGVNVINIEFKYSFFRDVLDLLCLDSSSIKSKPTQIEDIIEIFESKEYIFEKFKCEKCDAQCNFTKQIKISRANQYLMIHLKRIDNAGHKNEKLIDFSTRLELCRNNFSLLGMSNHYEIAYSSGHYTAIVKKQNRWYCFNDGVISDVKTLVKDSANMLFYEKIF